MSSQPKRLPSPSQPEPSNPPVVKHKRRKRDDLINRNYTCGCGKSYLSYPALYTHLKQKHNGKQPLGTNLPSSNRGRKPKSQKEDPPVLDATSGKESEQLQIDEKIEEFLEYLNTYAAHMKTEHDIELKLVQEKTSPPVNNTFPQAIFKNPDDVNAFVKNLDILNANPTAFQEDGEPEMGLSKICINKILALFLFKLSKKLTQDAYKEICMFMVLFRRTLNKHGWSLKNVIPTTTDAEFCEQNPGDFILHVANDMFAKELKPFLDEFGSEGLNMLGNENEKAMNVIYMTECFAKWLFSQNFTDFKLDLNYE